MNSVTEWSVEFDLLYNNIMSNQAPGLNEYEKSVLLTMAQDEILKNYFNPKGNKYSEGFDDSTKRQIDFSMLIETNVQTEPITSQTYKKIDPRSRVYSLPEGIFAFLNESLVELKDSSTVIKTVVPVSYIEYTRLMKKPYKNPLKNQVWRLMNTNTGISGTSSVAELIGKISSEQGVTVEYTVRYVRQPKPIILTNLSSGLEIHGESTVSNCELDPMIHDEILHRAVELAKVMWVGDLNTVATIGQRNE